MLSSRRQLASTSNLLYAVEAKGNAQDLENHPAARPADCSFSSPSSSRDSIQRPLRKMSGSGLLPGQLSQNLVSDQSDKEKPKSDSRSFTGADGQELKSVARRPEGGESFCSQSDRIIDKAKC